MMGNRKFFFFEMDVDILHQIEKTLDKRKVDLKKRPEIIKRVINEAAPDIASKMYVDLKKGIPALLKNNKITKTSFEKRLNNLWKEPLDLLEAFLYASIEIGDMVSNELRLLAVPKHRLFVDVISRLHGQACLIGNEIREPWENV